LLVEASPTRISFSVRQFKSEMDKSVFVGNHKSELSGLQNPCRYGSKPLTLFVESTRAAFDNLST
jgi:hypothetical protein